MARPRYISSYALRVGPLDDLEAAELEMALKSTDGVDDVAVEAGEGVAYLKLPLNQF